MHQSNHASVSEHRNGYTKGAGDSPTTHLKHFVQEQVDGQYVKQLELRVIGMAQW
jgi:hypothetical protein